MKLQTFNTKNCETSGRTSKPKIGIDTKTGLFRINKGACEAIGLNENSKVIFHHDEENEGDWYLETVKDEGFDLRRPSKTVPVLVFNSSTLARKIADSVAFEKRTGNIIIPKSPLKHDRRTLWPLLTASLRN